MLLTNGASRLLGGGRVPWYRAGGAPLPVAAYCPKGAASLADSYRNLARADGTYNAAPGTAPTFAAATGWTFNGSSQYLVTGVAPRVPVWSMLLRFSGYTQISTDTLAGATNSAINRYFGIQQDVNVLAYNNGAYVVKSPGLTAGVLAVAGLKGYRNGVEDATINSTAVQDLLGIYIGARNSNGTATQFTACSVQALAIYNVTLTAPQVAAVSAAMAAL